MTVFCPLSTQPVYLNRQLQVGAPIMVFDAQTLTPRTAFKDGLAATEWLQVVPGQPPPPAGALVTDVNGCIPLIWIVGNPYKLRIVSPGGILIREVDNLPGDVAGGGGGGGGGGTAALLTGDYVWSHSTGIANGRVRANGKSIGNGASGGSERANDDAQALFVTLWNNDPTLTVSGGRGASALADFNPPFNKTIALPDLNARTLYGIDGMGSSPTGRFSGGLFLSGNATTLGSRGGEAAHVLQTAEGPPHVHSGTTQANAGFSLTFTTNGAGSHSHGGATTSAGDHSHGGQTLGNTGFQMTSVPNSMSQSSITVPTFATGAGGFQSVLNSASLNFGLSGGPNVSHVHGISSDGSHLHGIFADGFHAHTGVTDAANSVHTHFFTTVGMAGATAHNTMPPFVLATCYLVL